MNNSNPFSLGKFHTEFENFITFDIESLFIETNGQSPEASGRQKEYISEHKPFCICYQFVRYNRELFKYEIETADKYKYTNDFNGAKVTDFYIIGMDCCERFVELMFKHCSEFNVCYSHNGSKYDNLLVLQQCMQKYKSDILMNHGKLL